MGMYLCDTFQRAECSSNPCREAPDRTRELATVLTGRPIADAVPLGPAGLREQRRGAFGTFSRGPTSREGGRRCAPGPVCSAAKAVSRAS